MRYRPTDTRLDDPKAVMEHHYRFKNGIALIVLGGYSAAAWEDVYARVQPDVILGANGVNAIVHDLDYWMCAENMTRSASLVKTGDADAIALMDMFHRDAGAKVKLVSHRSWGLLKDDRNCVKIRRQGYEEGEIFDWFSFREYGLGYLAGWTLKHTEAGVKIHVGTVAAQLLHHAGILGCSVVHTIGLDLMFKDHERHHAYPHPIYKVDKFRKPGFRVTHKGAASQWAWVESAQFFKLIEPLFERDGLKWIDHSDGLLKVEGLKCANE